jgi:hypothetical protein
VTCRVGLSDLGDLTIPLQKVVGVFVRFSIELQPKNQDYLLMVSP